MDPFKNIPLTLLLLLLTILPLVINAIKFHERSTGVVFSPYVHKSFGSIPNDWSTYSHSDVDTMTKLISTRFSKVTTYGVGSRHDGKPYNWNDSYNQSYSQVYVTEAVAKFNKEIYSKDKHTKPITVYVGIFPDTNPDDTDKEIDVALESIDKANKIFEDTVKGLIFTMTSLTTVDQVHKHLDDLRIDSLRRGIDLGTRQNCGNFNSSEVQENVRELIFDILEISNFVICTFEHFISKNVSMALAEIQDKLLEYRKFIKSLNPWIEVMAEVGIGANGENTTATDNLREYWQGLDAWAYKNDIYVWMNEAFDNPWKRDNGGGERNGWWTLRNDALASHQNGYIEKVRHIPEIPATTEKGKFIGNVTTSKSKPSPPPPSSQPKTSSGSVNLSQNKKFLIICILSLIKYLV